MSRYIDVDALIYLANNSSVYEWDTDTDESATEWVMWLIDEIPEEDVEKVVRCKDCIHKKFCSVPYVYDFNENDYCSYGQDKEDL